MLLPLTRLSNACAAASWTLTKSCSGVMLSRSPARVKVLSTKAVWEKCQALGPPNPPYNCPVSPSPPTPLFFTPRTITLSQEKADPIVLAPPASAKVTPLKSRITTLIGSAPVVGGSRSASQLRGSRPNQPVNPPHLCQVHYLAVNRKRQ